MSRNSGHSLPERHQVVHVSPCPRCGADTIVAPCVYRKGGRLPPSPNKGVWRAFDRALVEGAGTWRSTKRHGMVPSKESTGFRAHDCPNADRVTTV